QPEVGPDDLVLCPLTLDNELLQLGLGGVDAWPLAEIKQVLGVQPGFDGLSKDNLLSGVEERRLGDLVQIYADKVALLSDLASPHHRHVLHFGPSPVVFIAFPALSVLKPDTPGCCPLLNRTLRRLIPVHRPGSGYRPMRCAPLTQTHGELQRFS